MNNIFICLIGFYLISCNNQNKTLILNANIIRSFDTLFYDGVNHKFFDIRLSIINKSQKPVAFWNMSCSWDDNLLINNDYIHFEPWTCHANAPEIVRIKPNDSLIRTFRVVRFDFTRYQSIPSTRIGLIYLDTLVCRNWDEYDEIMGDKSKMDKIIWSNSLHLRK